MEAEQQMAPDLRALVEPESEHLRAARGRSEESDIVCVAAETGATLRCLTRMQGAHHVVEVGSGGGYSGLWLVGGIAQRGTLTTIEIDADRQALAQRAFAEARVADRVRSMRGPGLAVLPRLADANYDIVFLDAVRGEYPEYLEHARRLLKPGGTLLANGMLEGHAAGRLGDFARGVREDGTFTTSLVPTREGLLLAVRAPSA